MKIQRLAALAALVLFCAPGFTEEVRINTTEENGRLVDDIYLPFVNDPAALGEWTSVDFIRKPKQFVPGCRRFQDDLYLKGLTFMRGGEMKAQPWWTWTKGVLMHSGDRTAARYQIKEMAGGTYMFLEWKSGDYTIRHQTPQYYVLKRTSAPVRTSAPAKP